MAHAKFFKTFVTAIFSIVIAFTTSNASAAQIDCYAMLTKLRYARFKLDRLGDTTPIVVYADGTTIPIARAFEKEGLLYSDIASWFPKAKPESAKKLRKRLTEELSGNKQPRNLLRWLDAYLAKYRPQNLGAPESKWTRLSPKAKLEYILAEENFFARINIEGREDLFYDGILNFDDLAISDATPERLTVGDDLGSYEVRSNGGSSDRARYMQDRKLVEDLLEGKVGHQHKVHAWPIDATKRALMAPKYIELLDASTWYLYWRQMKRNPAQVESILSHPYLGVYSRYWLIKLHEAVTSANPQAFKNKFRMVGARNFKADPAIENQDANGEIVPDWELRSGNKSDNRDFVEDMIEARIASGDYSGLRDFRDYNFDPAAPIEALTYPWLSEAQIEILKLFEQKFPYMKYSRQANAHNHYRTKIIAPLLPWGGRLALGYKREILAHEQRLYAERLSMIAPDYISSLIECENSAPAIAQLNKDTLARLERSAFIFADRVRLDLDFERYLKPAPKTFPSMTVVNTGPIDVNAIAQGIEYSFRFPSETPIHSSYGAREQILRTIERIRDRMGDGPIEQLDNGGHGHGASVRYQYTDPKGRVWRAEWDGVQREYIEGKLIHPHGGHIEVPSPKFYPNDPLDEIKPLFEAARSNGLSPKRSAGGGHVNTDLGPIKKLPVKRGINAIKSLIGYVESNLPMMQFLWQHPKRTHAARPVELKDGFAERLNAFDGDWDDFAMFLYEEQYFNPYISRKPRYVPMDLTGLMAPAVPSEYRKGTLDIKNPKKKWFPDFGKGKDRVEFRLYDAPTDELMAVLQIKYHRALLNKAFNARRPIKIQPIYTSDVKEQWRSDAKIFLEAAEKHLRDLGLDPEEFRPLLQDSWETQQTEPAAPKDLKRYERWLPARDPNASHSMLEIRQSAAA